MIRKLKDKEGITLIALVITIIVLLILAGVAIAMLSGENGILKKAAEAKTKTEQAQQEEEVALATMDLETYFLTNNLKYKCSNGFVTGFSMNDGGTKSTEKVKDFENILPDGYTINLRYSWSGGNQIKIEESEKETMTISTGMAIQKDGQTVARTVIFGDIDGDGEIQYNDSNYIHAYLSGGVTYDFAITAMDVNHDNYLSGQEKELEDEDGNSIENKDNEQGYQVDDGTVVKSDEKMIRRITNASGEVIDQNKYASKLSQLKDLGKRSVVKEFIEKSLPEEFKKSKFKLEANYDERDKSLECYLRGVTSDTKIKEVLDALTGVNAKITKPKVTYTDDSIIENGSILKITIDEKYEITSLQFKIQY